MKIICRVILLVFISYEFANAQGQNRFWYFGTRAGLNFNTSPPTSIESDLVTNEGTATVSDPSGNLLFYTSGSTVWDRNHNIMPNGTGLTGGFSSTQAALIVPMPNSFAKYYLFTTEDHLSNGGLSYSILDMRLNGGFGDIIPEFKNILLLDHTAEKNVAALHANGVNIWIITHKLNSDKFFAYLLTASGLDTTPVISAVGSFHESDAFFGPIKVSHNGSRIAVSSPTQGIIELFDFNSTTGIISNPYDLNELFLTPQEFDGIEFSPNDSLLYISSFRNANQQLYQVDFASNSVAEINSAITIEFFGPIQLGADNKIYMARNAGFLDVIHQPDEPGALCLYEEAGQVLLPGTRSRRSLPNYVPYSFHLDTNTYALLGGDKTVCNTNIVTLRVDMPPNCERSEVVWSTGSTQPEIHVDAPGIYWVAVNSTCTVLLDTIMVTFVDCLPIVHYTLDSCSAYMHNGSNMNYSEFIPAYLNVFDCAGITASNVYRDSAGQNKHSCTEGVNGSVAMCVSSSSDCQYEPGLSASIVIEITVAPAVDSIMRITGLEFYQRAPDIYSWINGGSGMNNYPQKFGIRILKDGTVIFQKDSMDTSMDWKLETFSFLQNQSFVFDTFSLIRFEILPYCLSGVVSDVTAWDIDEIKLYGYCMIQDDSDIEISGKVVTIEGQGIPNVNVYLSVDSLFSSSRLAITDEYGTYKFTDIASNSSYYIKGIRNDDIQNGVTVEDLNEVQRHLLGSETFSVLNKCIASDLDRDNKITSFDLMEMNKVIQGVHDKFKRKTNWRFCSVDQDMNSTILSEFNDIILIENTGPHNSIVDLIGIKIGDVNGDVRL